MALHLPSEGQVVLLRGEYWAVTEIKSQGLPRSSADESNQLQHLVSLSSLAEERLGHEIEVLWEIEVGASVMPDLGLPDVSQDRFDEPEAFAAFLDAMRWGAVTSADTRTLQAPFRSGAKIEAYQLEPLRRALSGARANMLLADDVGLGKTIEAGLVVQELLLRHRAKTVCVVVPAGLAIKWKEEMIDKFGLDFVIINSEELKNIRRRFGTHVNPFSFFPRVIVSMQWLPGERAQGMLTEIYDKVDSDASGQARAYDILIVDEAAHVAPASPQMSNKERRGYAVDTQRTFAVRELARRCENRLFLTATPHNGYTESFTALLEMIDDRRFVRGAIVDQKSLSEVVVRRLKKDLTEAGVRKFPSRKVIAIPFTPSEEELNAYKQLDAFLERRKAELKKAKVSDMATLLLKKRFLSSPLAFAYTVDNYLAARGLSIEDAPDYDEVLGERADDQEEGLIEQDEAIALRAGIGAGLELNKTDQNALNQLSKWGRGFLGKPDSRLQALLDYLNKTLRNDVNEINDERIVIFSEYVDTVNWIKSMLESHGFGEDRVAVIIGTTDSDDREQIKAQFQADPSEQALRILLATDAAGEGIDLQNFCHRLVNFDIPFNPNRLEQRAGRIDRYGQDKDPEIYHFGANSESGVGYAGDIEMLARVLRKVVQQVEDLGSVNQIIAEEIQTKLTGRKSSSTNSKSKDKQPKKTPSKDDLVIAKMMLGEREVRSELTQLETQLEDTLNRLHVRPENLRRVVDTALRMDHQPPLKGKTDGRSGTTVFEVPKLTLGWQSSLSHLATRLDPSHQRFITFDSSVAEGRQDLVLVHLGHPLVQHAARILRAALWRPDSELNRVTAVSISGLKDPVVAALCRLVLVGKGGVRLHEEVFLAGVRLKGKALGEEASEVLLEESLDGKNLISLSANQQFEVVQIWNAKGTSGDIAARLAASIELRKSKRLQEVTVLLQDRKKLDIERVKEIFQRFDGVLLESLKQAEEESEIAESQLFPEEKLQRSKDVAKWRERREVLEAEKSREIVKVERRYEEIQPYEFSAALVFAYPQEDAK